MKFIHPLILCASLLLLCSCTIFDAKRVGQASVVPSKPLVMPVGKNWQVIEEAPKLANERERLPFQMEQSVQPGGQSLYRPGRTVRSRRHADPQLAGHYGRLPG